MRSLLLARVDGLASLTIATLTLTLGALVARGL